MAQILPRSMNYQLDSLPPGFRSLLVGGPNRSLRTTVEPLSEPIVSEGPVVEPHAAEGRSTSGGAKL